MQYQVQFLTMPLAVYREVAAHLQQVLGVETELISQPSQPFDYSHSQVGGLQIRHSEHAEPGSHQQVEQILAYYRDRHGAYQRID